MSGRKALDRTSPGVIAMLVGLAAEGVLIWLFDRLPTWLQVTVLAPPILLFALGMGLLLRDRAKRRRMERERKP